MATENWTEERDRLIALLRDYEDGTVSGSDEIDDGAVKRATTEERIAAIRDRLAALDDRLGSRDEG